MGNKNVPLERMIHLGVQQLLLLNAVPGLVWTHVANERRTTPREGAFLKKMGVRAGWADFTLIIPQMHTHGLGAACTVGCRPVTAFLEIKRPGGRLSVAQEAFRDDVLDVGCLWDIVYSTDRAAEVLRSWGALRSISLPNRPVREAA